MHRLSPRAGPPRGNGGIEWPHCWLSGGIEQEQVIKCRLAREPEVTFKKQIWRERAHGKTRCPLLALVPPP